MQEDRHEGAAWFGLTLKTAGDYSLRVVNVDTGSAAFLAQVLPGDVLVEVDGAPVENRPQGEVDALFLRRRGSSVKVAVRRHGARPLVLSLPAPRSLAPSAQSSAHGAVGLTGVGLGIALDALGHVCVTSIAPNGPADRSGLIQLGDIIRSVDGRDIAGLQPDDVKPLILGAPATPVTVGVRRGTTALVVRLTRSGTAADPIVAPASDSVGVGLSLLEVDGTFVVKALTEGGAAQRSNLIKTGDALRAVDGLSVEGLKMDGVRRAILGPAGSNLSLTFDRADPSDRRRRRSVTVRLRRAVGSASVPSILPTPLPTPALTPRPTPLPTPQTSRPPSPRGRRGEGVGGQCGVGVVIQQQRDGAYVVTAVTEGSPAGRSGFVRRHDVIESIDNQSIKGLSMDRVRPLVLGPMGSTVSLGLRRGADTFIIAPIVRDVVRPPAPPPPKSHKPPANPSPPQKPQQGQRVPPPPTRREEAAEDACGIGVVLVATSSGAMAVQNVLPNGPAAQSGAVRRGDILRAIDGRAVEGGGVEDVRPQLLGRAGTLVTLTFARERRTIEATLVRGKVPLGCAPLNSFLITPQAAMNRNASVPFPFCVFSAFFS
jgi:C-terminal processing protease CtpA/Prc